MNGDAMVVPFGLEQMRTIDPEELVTASASCSATPGNSGTNAIDTDD